MAKEAKDKLGTCRFCFQSRIVSGSGNMTDEQLIEAATLSCDCEEAVRYQAWAQRTMIAKRRVDELFGDESSDSAQPDIIRNYMKQGIDLINNGSMKKLTVNIGKGLTCRISLVTDEKIKVTREIKSVVEFKQ